MCKDVRNSYIVHKLGIQRVPYDIRNYAVMRVFGIFLWGSPLKCHGDIMRVYDFKRLGTLHHSSRFKLASSRSKVVHSALVLYFLKFKPYSI